MKIRLLVKITSTCLCLLAGLPAAKAASGAWTGLGGDAAWADPNNWTFSPAPGTGDTATFNGAGNSITTIDLGPGVTVSNITFDTANAAAYTIGLSGSQQLTLNDSGFVVMTGTEARSQLFNAQILLGTATGASYTFTNSSSGGVLILSGGIQGGLGGTGQAKTLTLAGNVLVSGVIANGGSSALGLAQAGAGSTLTLTATNTFTGAISGIGGTLTIGGAGLLGGGTAPYAGAIANGGTFIYNSSATETNTGIMSGAGGLTQNGPGTLALGAAPNTYSGPTTINGGILQINSASGGNGFSENSVVNINAGGELDLNASDALGYSLSLPLTNSGILKKLVNQSETLGRPIILNGGSLVTTLAGDEQFETFNNYILTTPNTANFVTGPGRFGLRTASYYISVGTNSTLTFALTVEQNGNSTLTPLQKQGAGTLILSGTNTFGGGMSISNGTLAISNAGVLGSGNYAGAISNYGVFAYKSSSSQILSGNVTNTGTINLSSGGNVVFSGTISGAGSVIQNGPGTAALYGNNTYTGLTTVNGGKLLVPSSQGNASPVTVNDGGALVISAEGTHSYSPGTLNVGSSAGASIEVGVGAGGQAPLTPVVLNLTGHNTLVVSGNIGVGSYPILSYTTLQGTGTLNNYVLPNGVTGTITLIGSTYTLNVTAVATTLWDSLVNGAWDINTTANWAAPHGGTTYLNGSPVVFDDADNTGGIYTVTNSASIVLSPSSVTVNNTLGNYSFGSNIVISGAGGLTKNGAGMLTNFGLDTYTGPTVINAGVILAGAASAGASPLGFNSAVSLANVAGAGINLNNFTTQVGSLSGGGALGGNVTMGSGTLIFGGDNTRQTYAGAISGTGGLTQIGSGSLTLTGPNTISGNINSISGTLTLSGAGQLNLNTYAGSITDNGVYNYSTSANQTNSGVISGSGALIVNGPGTLTLGNSGDAYSGATIVNGGFLVLQATTGGSGNIGNSAITINRGGEMDLNINDALGYGVSLPIVVSGVLNKIYNQAETLSRPMTLSNGIVTNTLTAGENAYETFGGYIGTVANTTNDIAGAGAFGLRTTSCYISNGANSVLNFSSPIYQYTGGTPLNLTGSGSVYLSGVSSFTAGINNSTMLALTNGGALDNGIYAGNIFNTGTFADGSTTAQVITGIISGSGALAVTTPGAALTLANVESYAGPTTIAAGTLFLSGSASIGGSSSISVASGSTFDVSGETGAYALGANQSLLGGGTVNGALIASSTSKIFPGTDGGVGLLTFNNGLTMTAGATANFDVSAFYNGLNDQIVVSGPLVLNGNAFHIKAPSTSLPLDVSGNDYVLISASGGITGSFSAAPVFDVAPSNFRNYSIITDPVLNQVRLHYSSLFGPLVSGAATPSTGVTRNQSVLITVTVNPGSGTVTNVSLNLVPFGGSATFPLVLSGVANIYTNTIVIPASVSPGALTLTASAIDTTPLSGAGSITLTVVTTVDKWDGLGGNGNWDTGANWTTGQAPGLSGDSLIFAGLAGLSPIMDNNYAVGSLTFDATAGAFNIGSTGTTLTVATGSGVTNNSVNPQTINAAVVLGGTVALDAAAGNLTIGQPVSEAIFGGGNLNVLGNGTVTLDGDNTYTGVTTINSNSTLAIGGAGQLNNGAYAVGIIDNGTLAYDSSTNQSLTGVLSGAGGLKVSAGATATLTVGAGGTVPYTYTGPTVVNSGTLALNFGNTGTNGIYASTNLTINGGTVVADIDNALCGATTALGTLPITIYTGGTLTGSDTADGGSGTSSHIRGILTLAGGTLAEGGSMSQAAYGSWDLDDGVAVNGGANTSTISALDVIPSQAGGTVFAVTNGNTASGIDLNITGSLIDGSSLADTGVIMIGNGTMALDGINTYAGATSISNGTFIVNGQLGIGAYNAAIVNNGAFVYSGLGAQTLGGTLSGTGSLQVSGGGSTLTLNGADAMTGPTTIVNNGALVVAATGSINGTSSLYVGAASTFDVSALTGFTLTGSETLSGSGMINGSVGTTPETRIFPGADGTYGTLTFFNNLSMNAGATLNYDLSTLSQNDGGNNDQIDVNGALVLNGNSIHIKAPSASQSLDTSDYILVSVNGAIQGSFASTPVWDVRPVNANNYTVETSGNNIVLHYSQFTPPAGYGTATPSTGVLRNESVLLTVTVTNSSSPILSVTVDATPLGGTVITLSQVGSSSVYTGTLVIPAGTGPGPEVLTATITDSHSLIETASIAFMVATSTEKWDGNGAAVNWSANGNWVSGAAPGLVGDNVVFAGSTRLTPLMDQNYTVAGLGFDSTAGAFTIGTISSTLTLTTGVTNSSPVAQTLNVPVNLSSQVTIDPATANLIFEQPIIGTGILNKVGPGSVTLLGANAYTGATLLTGGTLDLDSTANQTLSGAISGSGSLTLDGTGEVVLTNYNSFTGGAIVNNGDLILALGGAAGTVIDTLTINPNGLVTLTVRDAIGYGVGECVSNLVINGGTFNMAQDNAGFSTVVNMTGGTLSDVGAPNGALFNFNNGFNLNTFATNTSAVVSAGIDIRGTNLIITTALGTVPGGADLIISGVINNSNNAGAGALIKAGPGTAVFTGLNTYPSGTTIAGGVLQADGGENPGVQGPFGTGPIAFAGGTLQYSDQNQFDYSSRFSTAGGQAFSIDTSNQIIYFETGLAGAGSSLAKLGLGTLTLEATNTYTGGTTISGGVLALTANGDITSSSGVAIGAGATFDVSGLLSYTLGAGASLTASGVIGNPAAINGANAEPINLGSGPITLAYDGAGPALTVSNGVLSLDGNAFTVNGSALPVGSFVIVAQTVGNISASGTFSVVGTAIGPGKEGAISVSGGRVLLTITAVVVLPPTNITYSVNGNALTLTWPANYKGWFLQSDSISLSNPNDWFDVAGSSGETSANITINKNGHAVFYRMQAP